MKAWKKNEEDAWQVSKERKHEMSFFERVVTQKKKKKRTLFFHSRRIFQQNVKPQRTP